MANDQEYQYFLEDDDEHPIPFIYNIDVFSELEGGGGVLSIITAQPLADDERTQKRLLEKIEIYLLFINSDQFPTEGGPHTIENTTIEVILRKGTSHIIIDLLEKCVPWVSNNNSKLLWKIS